jgi:DNA replication protein
LTWKSIARNEVKGFAGFPEGRVRLTPLPDLFFSQLLPQIDNLAELKVTLHLFWVLQRKKGYPRYASHRALLEDSYLLAGLKAPGRPAEEALKEGLERAVARGTLLRLGDGNNSWYFLNTPQSRGALDKIVRGELQLEEAPPSRNVSLEVERPNVFTLYEQNIGLLQPMIAEELREAEKIYPLSWIEEAFKIAVERNARNWRYIQKILERWAKEGKGDGTHRPDSEEDRHRYIKGEYADHIEH